MGRVFINKQFSDYLGENRAINDIVVGFVSDPVSPSPTPTPSITPTNTQTPTVTNTPTPSFLPYFCTDEIIISGHTNLPELDGTYSRVYTYSGGSYLYGFMDLTGFQYGFFPGPYSSESYPVYVNTSPGAPYTATTLGYNANEGAWDIFEGSPVDNTIYAGTTPFSSNTITYFGGSYLTEGQKYEFFSPAIPLLYVSYPLVCPTTTPTPSPTQTPSSTP